MSKLSQLNQKSQLREKAQQLVESEVFCSLPTIFSNPANASRLQDLSETTRDLFSDADVLQYKIILEQGIADALKDQGEIVHHFITFSVWGRTTAGQSVYMDGIFQKALDCDDEEAKKVIERCVLKLPQPLEDALFSSNLDDLADALQHLDEQSFCDDDDSRDDILEYWLVSSDLGKDLLDLDEYVVPFDNCYLWGRTISGQSVYMDSVILEIAHILLSKIDSKN